MACIHQKTKGGTWYITYRQADGQKHRSLSTRSRRQALRLKTEIEHMLDSNGSTDLIVMERAKADPKNPDVDEFWPRFLKWAEDHRAPSTIEEYQNWFVQFRKFAGIRRLGDATRADFEAFKTKLTRQGRKKPRGVGLDRASINNALKTLNAIWNHAIKLGLYSGDNPVASVERYRLPQQMDRDYLDEDDVSALLEAARAHMTDKYVKRVEARNVYLAIALMALAGLRKREACFARWDWMDWDQRVIRVTNDDTFTTKNKKPRVISMNGQLKEILLPYEKDDGYVLETVRKSDEKTFYRADFKKAFKKVCDLAGIRSTPHELRHSFASRHAVAGTSLHVIAGWLGHSTTWVTQCYAHFQKSFNAAADNI